MTQVNIHDAKTHLSRLLERVSGGEEIIIAKAGVPIARVVPYVPEVTKRRRGSARGEVWVGDDFDDPLPEDIQAAFE